MVVAHMFDMEEVMEIEHSLGKNAKKPVDDNAPKRNLSAFFLWGNKMRPKIMKKHKGESMAIVGKELAILWRKTSSTERAPFEKKAAADKKTYEAKMEKYMRTSNYKKHHLRLLAWKIHNTKKPFRKDENAPKRPLSAYMLYAISVRSTIVDENPDMEPTEVMKEQSVMWKTLGDSDRNKWGEKAASEKKKYEAKLARYMKTRDCQKYIDERDSYKVEMKNKRNKLLGIRKRVRTPTKAKDSLKQPSKKKAKRRSRTPKSSKSRSRSRSTSRRRRAKSPKSPKRRSRKRRADKRKSRAPKARKRRSTSRRSRTPKASKSRSASRRRTRRARTPKGPKVRRSRSVRRSKNLKATRRSASRSPKRRSRNPKASKKRTRRSRTTSRSKSRRRPSNRRSRSSKRRSTTRSKSRRRSTSRRSRKVKKAKTPTTDAEMSDVQ